MIKQISQYQLLTAFSIFYIIFIKHEALMKQSAPMKGGAIHISWVFYLHDSKNAERDRG